MPLPDVRSFRLVPEIVGPLRKGLPEVAVQTIDAITAEVPAYAEAFAGPLGAKIERAVRTALGTFLDLVSRAAGSDPGSPLAPALEAAYALGRGEARSGRTLDALLAAYRVGARVAWRELAGISVGTGQPAPTIAHFAELVFAYIDELSAASVAGHADELASSGRARLRHLEQLAQSLIAGDAQHVLLAAAERAEWTPPQTLTAVLLPERATRSVGDAPGPAHAAAQRGRLGAARAPWSCWSRTRTSRPARTCAGCCAATTPWSARPGRGCGPAVRTTGRYAPWGSAACARWTGSSTPRTTSPSWPSPPTRRRWPTCAPGSSRRSAAGPRRPPPSWSRRCGAGCCTRAAARRWRPSCSCTRRPCATG